MTRGMLAEAKVHLVQALVELQHDPKRGLQGYLEWPPSSPTAVLSRISWPMTVMLVTLYCRTRPGTMSWDYCRVAAASWRGAWVDYHEGELVCGTHTHTS